MAHLWPGLRGPSVDFISGPPSAVWCEERPRTLVILGSTGSIGRNTLAVVDACPGFFRVLGLSCARNAARLAEQAAKYRPPYLAVLDADAAAKLTALLPVNYRPRILIGPEGYAELAELKDASTVVSAQTGAAGLAGTLAAAEAGKVICLANKESLVLAGSLVRDICSRTGAAILPVDSEHNAVFQCLSGHGQDVADIVLTASGGPFLGKSAEALARVTPEQALRHPNWSMGQKITIDSASMMNKGLEVIEAFHLYGVPLERIRVLVHPQSIVHSMVSFKDGSLLAQFATADMRLPIANCLCWPESLDVGVPPLDLAGSSALSFAEPDMEAFPCLALALRALRQRGGMCVVLNAANEAAVEIFLHRGCGFMDIPRFISAALDAHAASAPGHEPFCPPLDPVAPAGDDARLRGAVAGLFRRVEALDRKTRAFVRDLAKKGVASC
ncbi:MAG: 1-deoxy-D-xylulose-5-phosphate reductoisomerase [Desulfovibrio sp.]|nr:1-deoxy-D-xylulose-5-phosphate reductoisomerase [Desulfovibrio sp.]